MAKRMFERESMSNGVKIRGYHADNVPFNSMEWKNDINGKNQELTLSGTGAHHQNGIAKRTIKTVVSWARAMLLHAVLHWPEQADLTLWPFALEYAIFIWNHLPNQQNGLCPDEIFSGSKMNVGGILCRLVCGDVQCMYWILGFKMVRSYRSGTQGPVGECSLDSVHSIPAL
jgi:hypothetical protein